MSVINRIMALLEERQISARKLTMDLKLANSCVSEWKKGKAKPSVDAIVKIANYFGVTTDYLLIGGEGPKQIETDRREQGSVQKMEQKPQSSDEDYRTLVEGFQDSLDAEENLEKIELSGEDRKLLHLYHKLDEEDREYILCKIVVLEREYAE